MPYCTVPPPIINVLATGCSHYHLNIIHVVQLSCGTLVVKRIKYVTDLVYTK